MEKSPIWNNLQWLSLNFVNKKTTHYQFIFNLCFKRHRMKRLLKNHTPRIPSIDHRYWTHTLFLDQSDIVILCYFCTHIGVCVNFWMTKFFFIFCTWLLGKVGRGHYKTYCDLLLICRSLSLVCAHIWTAQQCKYRGRRWGQGPQALRWTQDPPSSKTAHVLSLLSKINPPSRYPVWYFSPELGLISLLRNHQLTQTTTPTTLLAELKSCRLVWKWNSSYNATVSDN